MTGDPEQPDQPPDDETPDAAPNVAPENQSTDTHFHGQGGETLQSIGDIFSGFGFDDATLPTRSGPRLEDEGRIGEYELLQKIGEGGMGVVYLARQTTVDRTVALKVIRPDRLELAAGSSSESVIERFRTEAKASAKLQHDNIVTIYEVGESAGRHYFSMRLVSGESLADLLRDRPLENRRTARYVRGIASGIAHAHQCGILHRDLKPQNVLVDSAADRPLITDFGLAKFTQHDSELTRHGEVVGTPAYMSPEQAKDSARVTELADVYAIGATMYHLLTGRPPFQAASPLDTLNQVLTTEPIAPRRLNPIIDKDLETICLKCLQKSPPSRYESASEVMEELDRYLDGKPIQARPIGPVTRLARWCRRKPLLATLAVTTTLLLIATLVSLTYAWVSTSRAGVKSELSFRLGLSTVNEFFTRASEEILLDQPGLQPYRRQMLQSALTFYQEFLRRRGDDPELREEVARTYLRIGVITKELGSPEAAVPYFRTAIELQQAIDSPTSSAAKLEWLSDTWTALGTTYHATGDFDDALACFEQGLEYRARLAAESASRQIRRKLANSKMNLGLIEGEIALASEETARYEAAKKYFLEAQEIRGALLDDSDDYLIRRDMAKGFYNWYSTFEPADDSKRVAELLEAVNLFHSLATEQPQDWEVKYMLAVCYWQLGRFVVSQKDQLETLHRARALFEELAGNYRQVAKYQRGLAKVYIRAGQLAYDGAGDASQARAFVEQAIARLEQLAQSDPDVMEELEDARELLEKLP